MVLGRHQGNDDLSRLSFASATHTKNPTGAPGEGTGGGEIRIRTRDLGVFSPPPVPLPPPGLTLEQHDSAPRVVLRNAFNDAISAFHASKANPTGAPMGETGGDEANRGTICGFFSSSLVSGSPVGLPQTSRPSSLNGHGDSNAISSDTSMCMSARLARASTKQKNSTQQNSTDSWGFQRILNRIRASTLDTSGQE